jgi:hypothetical protein
MQHTPIPRPHIPTPQFKSSSGCMPTREGPSSPGSARTAKSGKHAPVDAIPSVRFRCSLVPLLHQAGLHLRVSVVLPLEPDPGLFWEIREGGAAGVQQRAGG